MKSMIPIIKKELKRFFTDKRILMSLFLPGIMIYVLYSLLGGLMGNLFAVDSDTEYNIYVTNQPEMINMLFDVEDSPYIVNFIEFDEEDLEETKNLVKTEEAHLVIYYDKDFYDLYTTGNKVEGVTPQVEIYYNDNNMESMSMYSVFYDVLNQIELAENNIFDVNYDSDKEYNLVDENSTSFMVAMLVPMLLMTFLASGVMGVAVESIAGEKERGTIASLLITPVSRFKLALAKILSITIPSLLSALVSFVGLILSLPKLFEDQNMSLGKFSAFEYISLLLVIIFTVLTFTVIISIISTFAKSIKESTQLSNPFLIVVSMTGVVVGLLPLSVFMFAIPGLNSALAFSTIFARDFTLSHLILTLISNFIVIVVGIFAISKMFNSEKIIFSK